MSALTFTLIQSNLHWENISANLNMFEEKIKSVSQQKEIVILPEMFSTGFSLNPVKFAEEMSGETIQWMQQIARDHKIILTGSIMVKENEQYFNRLIWMQPDGEYGTYDKRHLFSYSGEDKEFSIGSKRFIAQVKGWKICTLICYDLRFPVWTRMQKADEYDAILVVANWPIKRIAAWKCLLQARAIENQCYVIAVNRTGEDGTGLQYSGESCVINPMGEIEYMQGESDDIFTIQLDKKIIEETRQQFPFQKDKDEFIIL